MFNVTFGKYSKVTARPSEKSAIRKFFRDVLGAPQPRETEEVDIFRLGPQFFLGVVYTKDAPTADAMQNSIWLELATADPITMKAKILAGGGKGNRVSGQEPLLLPGPRRSGLPARLRR